MKPKPRRDLVADILRDADGAVVSESSIAEVLQQRHGLFLTPMSVRMLLRGMREACTITPTALLGEGLWAWKQNEPYPQP